MPLSLRALVLIVVTWLAASESADAQFAPPAPRSVQLEIGQPGSRTQTIISGGLRKITHIQRDKDGEEILEIEDRNEKEIKIRRTRTVNGEKKTEEFQAPDFDSLKTKNAEAAELYRRHAERSKLMQPVPVNNAVFPSLSRGPAPGSGERKITAKVKGVKVQLEDQYGAEIRLTITDAVGGAPPRAVKAANLAELDKSDPEAAQLYRRLTGEN